MLYRIQRPNSAFSFRENLLEGSLQLTFCHILRVWESKGALWHIQNCAQCFITRKSFSKAVSKYRNNVTHGNLLGSAQIKTKDTNFGAHKLCLCLVTYKGVSKISPPKNASGAGNYPRALHRYPPTGVQRWQATRPFSLTMASTLGPP